MNHSPDSLFQQLSGASESTLPPVHLWHPTDIKDIGMRITRDGTWWHQGEPIRRQPMVRLFSRVLRRDDDGYFLVTPVEKVRVDVEAAPLLAVRMERRDDGSGPEIAFQTNVGDLVVADRDHPVRMLGTRDAPLPVVVVRNGIEALIARNIYYDLVDAARIVDSGGREMLVVESRGEVFELGAV